MVEEDPLREVWYKFGEYEGQDNRVNPSNARWFRKIDRDVQ